MLLVVLVVWFWGVVFARVLIVVVVFVLVVLVVVVDNVIRASNHFFGNVNCFVGKLFFKRLKKHLLNIYLNKITNKLIKTLKCRKNVRFLLLLPNDDSCILIA